MRRRWIIATLVAGLLAAAIAGGTVMAWGGKHGHGGGIEGSSLTAKVAEILELDEQTVADAFEQARHEVWVERTNAMIDRMAERGAITEEEAEQYRERLESGEHPFFFGHRHGRGGFHGEGSHRTNTTPPAPATPSDGADSS